VLIRVPHIPLVGSGHSCDLQATKEEDEGYGDFPLDWHVQLKDFPDREHHDDDIKQKLHGGHCNPKDMRIYTPSRLIGLNGLHGNACKESSHESWNEPKSADHNDNHGHAAELGRNKDASEIVEDGKSNSSIGDEVENGHNIDILN